MIVVFPDHTHLLFLLESSKAIGVYPMGKGVLAIRSMYSLVDMIINIKFSNCPNVFKIGVVWHLNMHSRQQIRFKAIHHLQCTFYSHSSLNVCIPGTV